MHPAIDVEEDIERESRRTRARAQAADRGGVVGDGVTVIGDPDSNGQVEARFISASITENSAMASTVTAIGMR